MKRLSAATYAALFHASAATVSDTERSAVAGRFLQLLRRQRVMKLWPRILMHLQRLDDRAHGRTRVAVTAPSADCRPAVAQQLTSLFGPVALDLTVDPALRGGLVLRVGDDEIDGSLRTRLRRLHHHLTHA